MRVLIIEDEAKVAGFIRNGLDEEHYAVDVARDGEEGLHQAENYDYDILILDLMLPRVPGLEVLKRLRARKPNLPVLILTAKGAVEDRVRGLDSGASDYLVKPFAFAELSARIRALLRRGVQEDTMLRMAPRDMAWSVPAARRAVRVGTTVEHEHLHLEIGALVARAHERDHLAAGHPLDHLSEASLHGVLERVPHGPHVEKFAVLEQGVLKPTEAAPHQDGDEVVVDVGAALRGSPIGVLFDQLHERR